MSNIFSKEDKSVDFFDKAKDVVIVAGNEIKEKAIDYADMAKLKKEVMDEKKSVKAKYEEIGRRYYLKHSDNEKFQSITDSLKRIDELEARIDEIKAYGREPDESDAEAEDLEHVEDADIVEE